MYNEFHKSDIDGSRASFVVEISWHRRSSIASSKKSPRTIAQIAILNACLFCGRIYFLKVFFN